MANEPGSSSGRIVVTGFRSFPGVQENPSQALVEALRDSPGLLPEDAVCRLLDVSYAAVPPVLAEILADPPAALVLTGFSARATGLRLETRAHDYCSPSHEDAFGYAPETSSEIRENIDQVRADLPAIAGRLAQAGIGCALSDDAGAYLCNHLYYRVLRRIAELDADTLAVFVHVPAITGSALAQTSAGAMPLEVMARGVAMIAEELARRT